MNTQVVTYQADGRYLTAADVRHRVNIIQEVMKSVMKKDVHYGIIPGCKKPSLYKPGSEVLLATFQIAPSIHVTDMSTEDCIRYQVRVVGTHAPSGMVVGEGIGECSSNEEKYKWRKAYDDEWNATPENRRRVKYGKYKDKQVRTEPADVANTILKMAKKRAQVDMTLTATGASDCFEQDVEDLPAEYFEVVQEPLTPEQEVAAREERKRGYFIEAYNRNEDAVLQIKERIAFGDLVGAAKAWYDLSQEDQLALYIAPTKAGDHKDKCFTTAQRDIIKTEFPKNGKKAVDTSGEEE